MSFDIYVADFLSSTSQNTLKEEFSKFGDVLKVAIMESKGKPLGTCFIGYKTQEQAERAVENNKKIKIGSQIISVRWPFKKIKEKNKATSGMKTEIPQLSEKQLNTASETRPVEDLLVTEVVSSCKFYAQNKENMQQIQTVSAQLFEACENTGSPVTVPLEPGVIYAAKFSQDGSWYRCILSEPRSPEQSLMHYIDYGNKELVNHSDIVRCPDFLENIPALTQVYSLFGLRPLYEDSEQIGYQEGIDLLSKLVLNEVVKASLYPKLADGSIPVVLTNPSECDINQEILNCGFALLRSSQDSADKRKTNVNQSPPVPDINFETDFIMPQKRTIPTSPQKLEDFGNTGWGESFNISNSNNIMSGDIGVWNNNQFVEPVATSEMNSATHFNKKPNQHQESSLPKQRPIKGSGRSLTTTNVPPVKNNEDELKKLRERIKHLQAENTNYQSLFDTQTVQLMQKSDEIMELQNKLSQNKDREFGGEKINNLISRIHLLKKLRLQFPTFDDSSTEKDIIEESIRTLISAESAGLTSGSTCPEVVACKIAHDAYEASQLSIINNCKNINDELIEERDICRSTLHDRIGQLLSALDNLSLQEHLNKVKDLAKRLSQSHSNLIGKSNAILPLHAVLEVYSSWKQDKMADFQAARTRSNTAHNALDNSLQSLQQNVSLLSNFPPVNLNLVEGGDIEELFRKFHSAIENEIALTDLSQSEESLFISRVVDTVLTHLQKEQEKVGNFETLIRNYAKLRDSIEPWLAKKPSITPLQDIRRTIKSLKSKLRHKLADKLDLEENEDSDNSEQLSEVTTDLAKIRYDLQHAFVQEDEQMILIAEAVKNHFPELRIQYFDPSLELTELYGGLVKQGRSIDYFDAEPLKTATLDQKNLLRCRVLNQEMLLREYLIDESISVSKAEFIKRALTYSSVHNPHLMDIKSIFFIKNDKWAYTQTAFCKTNLYKRVTQNSTPMEEKDIVRVANSVLKAVIALHDNDLVHGSITPNNVYFNQDAEIILSEYNFSKSLDQRLTKPFVTNNGLHFVTPEVAKNSGKIGKASDIYNFGLLVLWMNFPNEKFEVQDNGTPYFSNLVMKNSLQIFFSLTLNANPAERMKAEQLLQIPYLAFRSDSTLQLRSSSKHTQVASSETGKSKQFQSVPGQVSSILKSPPVDYNNSAAPNFNKLTSEKSHNTPINNNSDKPKPIKDDLFIDHQENSCSVEDNSSSNLPSDSQSENHLLNNGAVENILLDSNDPVDNNLLENHVSENLSLDHQNCAENVSVDENVSDIDSAEHVSNENSSVRDQASEHYLTDDDSLCKNSLATPNVAEAIIQSLKHTETESGDCPAQDGEIQSDVHLNGIVTDNLDK